LIFKLGNMDPALTADQITRVKNDFRSVVGPAWSNKFSVKVTDPVCGEKTLPILVRVLWNPDDTSDTHHYTVDVTTASITANVTGTVVSLGYQDDVVDNGGWVMTHEFGHTFGLPDEYFYASVTSASVTYKLADSCTETITLEPPDDSIMQTNANTTILKRFFYLAAIEAQELFRRTSGRSVVCEVV
jgi:type VI secretion system secreted protein VgrG